MAPNSQWRPPTAATDNSTGPGAVWRRDNPTPHLPYDDWASSQHALGPYLYHLTLDAWDEATSSEDDEPEEEHVKVASSGLPEREPTKTVTANGNAILHVADKPTPTADAKAKAKDPVASTKKRQRRKKKFLSEAIVASDDSDIDESAPIAEVATPSAAVTVVNGRRTSSARKQKKKFLSASTVQTEEDSDEPTLAAETTTSNVADVITNRPNTLPARKQKKKSLSTRTVLLEDGMGSTPNVAAAVTTGPSTSSARKQKKKVLSEPVLLSEEEKESTPVAEVATPTATSATPEGSNTSSAVRRGLRVRTPAQQRPYYHHAKLFEEAGSADEDGEGSTRPSPKATTTKLAQVLYPDNEEADHDNDHGQDSGMNRRVEQRAQGEQKVKTKPKPQPKGRRWKKKNDDDDDSDFVALVATQLPSEPKPKRRGRPRKIPQLSETYVRDESDLDAEDNPGNNEAVTKASSQDPSKPDDMTKDPELDVTSPVLGGNNEEDEDFDPSRKNSTPKVRSKVVEEDSHEKKGENEDQENRQFASSPLQKIQKRKGGSISTE